MTPTSKQAALAVYLLPMFGLIAAATVAALPALQRSQLRIEQQIQQTAVPSEVKQ